MFKKFMTMALLVMFVTSAALVSAAEVYVTDQGAKYHQQSCRFTKDKEAKAVEELEALEQGYEPCGVCLKAKLKEGKPTEQSAKAEKK